MCSEENSLANLAVVHLAAVYFRKLAEQRKWVNRQDLMQTASLIPSPSLCVGGITN